MNKVRLHILGLSYSQTQTGAYALVLAEENGNRRLPIIIGSPEAQSIAIQLEGLKPVRPLTHDLFVTFANAFNISIIEVVIHKLSEGIFHSVLICQRGEAIIKLDARTSDAVALALRFFCPIYTTDEIIERAGIMIDFGDKNAAVDPGAGQNKQSSSNLLSTYTIDELELMLNEYIAEENYEEASKVRDEIKRREEASKHE